jgi:hypothetical protein
MHAWLCRLDHPAKQQCQQRYLLTLQTKHLTAIRHLWQHILGVP